MATAAYPLPIRHFEVAGCQTTRTARDLRASVEQALEHGGRHFVFDCGAWSRLDVITLSSLVRCTGVCRDAGASFEVANVSSELKEHVRQLGLVERLGLNA